MNILVAEDFVDIATMLDIMLSLEGHKVKVQSFCFAALLNKEAWAGVDVALLDYNLSEDITGEDIACWLRENLPQVRSVILTGDHSFAARYHEVRDCADVILLKPCSADDLMKVVRG